MIRSIIFVLAVLLLIGCINEIDVNLNDSPKQLVVDGMITDKPGPYTIRLSWSKGYFEINERKTQFDQVEDVAQNAIVVLENDRGFREIFTEISPGLYKSSTSGILGKVGAKYKLEITLEDGSSYESNTETMHPNVGIKEYDKKYITKTVLNELNNEVNIDGFQITLLPNSFAASDFYRWRWEGTYEIETFPHLKQEITAAYSDQLHHPTDSLIAIPAPLPCSGFERVWAIVTNSGDPPFELKEVGPCECCQCWVTEITDTPIVSTTSIGTTKVFFDFFEYNNARFGQKYHVKLQQLSLSKEAHEFWKIIEQQQNSGSLFSTSNTTVPSNIKSLDNPNEKVLGFFSAVSIDEISIFLDESIQGKDPIVLDTITGDCRLLKNTTGEKPSFW